MSQLNVLSGFRGGAAIAVGSARDESKLEMRVKKDSERFMVGKIRSTPMSPFRRYHPRIVHLKLFPNKNLYGLKSYLYFADNKNLIAIKLY
jgi:hypothetical protein